MNEELIDYVAQLTFLRKKDIIYLQDKNINPDWILYYMRMLYPYPEDMPENLWYDLLRRTLHFGNTSLTKRIILKERPYITEDIKQYIREISPSDVINVMDGTYEDCLFQITNIDECLSSLPEFAGEKWGFDSGIKTSRMISILMYLYPSENICLPYTRPVNFVEIDRISINWNIDSQTKEQHIDPILDDESNSKVIYNISKCVGDLSVIPGSIRILVDDRVVGPHATMFIIDNIKKTVERFEPHGQLGITFKGQDFVENGVMDEAIRNLTAEAFPGYTFIPTLEFCPSRGPQASESYAIQKGFTQIGFCAAFSMLYLHLRLINTDMSQKEVVSQMMKGGRLATYKRILKYANLIDLYTK